jgi:hypothetical protein
MSLRNKMGIWHILDFSDNAYVLFKDNFRERFFQKMFEESGGKRPYARFLHLSQMSVKTYYQGYTYKNGIKHVQAVPLSLLKKSLSLMNSTLKNELEKNIIGLKGRGKCSVVSNVKLPFKESPEFYRIVAHVIADGSASERGSPYYANTCKELRSHFVSDLKIFGDVPSYENTSGSVPMVCFPKIITDILSYILRIKFTYPNHLPKLIFDSSDECKSALLQAIFDDEGTISTNLAIKMNSYTLVKEIRDLTESLGIKTTKIVQSINSSGIGSYSFNVSRASFLGFKEKIGFVSPNKIKNLDFAVNLKDRVQRTRNKCDLEEQIIKILNGRNIKTLDIANKMQFTLNYMSKFLKIMENEGKIICSGFKNKVYWSLPMDATNDTHNN